MIDIEKFICSLLADHPEGVTIRGDIHRALKEQGLEYKDGKIVSIEDKTELKESKDEQESVERKDFISIPFGTDSELVNETITIPDGCVATIEGDKIHIKREGNSATEAIKLNHVVDNNEMVEPKFKSGDIIHCKLDNRTFIIKEVDLKKGVYIYTEKGCGNDINYADEMFELVEPNSYTGTSFVYNNHTWGMCARDNGVEILIDGEIKAFISSEKSFIYPTPLQNNGTSKVGFAIEAIKEEAVDNINKPKFHEGDTIVEKDFFECDYEVIKEIKDGKYIFTDGSTLNIDEQDGWLLVKPPK